MKMLKSILFPEFADMFVDELGADDCMWGDPVKLEVGEGITDPYN